MILHIINKSPLTHSCFSECLKFCKDGSSILFIEDGVYANHSLTAQQHQQLETKKINLYVLEADITARGLKQPINSPFGITDDKGFVELIINHHGSQSWY